MKPLVLSLRAVESSLKKKSCRLSYRLGDFANLLLLDLHLFIIAGYIHALPFVVVVTLACASSPLQLHHG
ncbi:hypothetical protein BH18THE2_BH18THE2_13680 [soil metagenome]